MTDAVADQVTAGALILAFPVTPEARLRRALASLDMALRTQAAAVAEWRASIATLKTTMAGLGPSWQGFAITIDGVAEGVRQIGDQAAEIIRVIDRAADVTPPR